MRHRDECSVGAITATTATRPTASTATARPFEVWAMQWLQPTVLALTTGSDFLRKTLLELTVPKLFAVDRQCVLFAVRLLREPAQKVWPPLALFGDVDGNEGLGRRAVSWHRGEVMCFLSCWALASGS